MYWSYVTMQLVLLRPYDYEPLMQPNEVAEELLKLFSYVGIADKILTN